MLSEDGINHTVLGRHVENIVNDCLQDWQAAGSRAVQEMMAQQVRDDDSSRAQFIISLIGNLAWAATVFFPPAASAILIESVLARGVFLPPVQTFATSSSASVLTKVVSVLGATVGSNTLGQLANPIKSLNWSYIDDYLGTLVPDIEKNLATVAENWINSDLKNHMIATFSIKTHPDLNHNNDKEFKDWYDSYEGGRELRKTVWEKFVFPAFGLEFEYGQQGMKKFLIRKLTDLKHQYDFEYKNYMLWITESYMDYMSEWHDPFKRLTFEQ